MKPQMTALSTPDRKFTPNSFNNTNLVHTQLTPVIAIIDCVMKITMKNETRRYAPLGQARLRLSLSNAFTAGAAKSLIVSYSTRATVIGVASWDTGATRS